MYVLTSLNKDEKPEYTAAVLAVSESIEKLKLHAQILVMEDEDSPVTTLEWGDWGTPKTGTWLVASFSWAERFEIADVEVLA